jgi:hypothetical protein
MSMQIAVIMINGNAGDIWTEKSPSDGGTIPSFYSSHHQTRLVRRACAFERAGQPDFGHPGIVCTEVSN